MVDDLAAGEERLVTNSGGPYWLVDCFNIDSNGGGFFSRPEERYGLMTSARRRRRRREGGGKKEEELNENASKVTQWGRRETGSRPAILFVDTVPTSTNPPSWDSI